MLIPDNDEELLDAFVHGALPLAVMCKVAARLQEDEAFRTHFINMLTLRALLPKIMQASLAETTADCAEVRKLFPAYREGTAGDSDIARLSAHVASCTTCGFTYEFGTGPSHAAATEAPAPPPST